MQEANIKNLRKEFINPFVRMLPVAGSAQRGVYRMGDAQPPGLEGYQPRWQVLNAVLGAQQTIQTTIDLPTDFYLLALLATGSAERLPGLFRAQLYDTLKKVRLQDRGIRNLNLGGAGFSPFFLREPYHFDLPRSQVKVIMQNMETAANTVQLVLYGMCAPFAGTIRTPQPK